MRELYVYYRVSVADAVRCEAVVRRLQSRLMHDTPGLRARLLVRPETPGGEQTWMETYALEGRDVDAPLQACIEAEAHAGLAPFLRGARHVEVFIARQ